MTITLTGKCIAVLRELSTNYDFFDMTAYHCDNADPSTLARHQSAIDELKAAIA